MTQTRSQSAEVKAANSYSLFASKGLMKPVTTVVERARQTQLLINAVSQDNYSQMKQVLEKGADPDYATLSEGSFLTRAIAKGDLDMIKILVEHKANVNKKSGVFGNTPLHTAVVNGLDLEIVFYLIEQGADPRIKNANSSTPLETMKDMEEPVTNELIEDTLQKRAAELDDVDKEAQKAERAEQANYINSLRERTPYD